jgi:hypothetical protein
LQLAVDTLHPNLAAAQLGISISSLAKLAPGVATMIDGIFLGFEDVFNRIEFWRLGWQWQDRLTHRPSALTNPFLI